MKIDRLFWIIFLCDFVNFSLSYSIDLNTTIYKSYAYNPFGESKILGNTNLKQKRNVLNLYNMISCSTGCNPLIYKGYGCFCGFLGSGQPVDGVDKCCKEHDWCYNVANCPYSLEYFIPYYWTCLNNNPHCSIDHGFFGGKDSCSYRLCQCDRILSNCLKRYNCPAKRAICETSTFRYIQNVLMNF
ncbi:basic phospholipase A2 homolog 1 [Onthophagus taurus]|uniref:basic phospholipase A2 homolog 1 n=1 Tax=Onthophagus taurus TaxID=166361 RepID=UPI0039BDB1A2